MIKGLIALFTSGIIFNPMILLGIVSGSYTILSFAPEEIRQLMLNSDFYLVICIVAACYTFIFARVYKTGGLRVDWCTTTGVFFWNCIRYLIAFVLSMSFVTMINIF